MKGWFSAPGAYEFHLVGRLGNLALPVVGFDRSTSGIGLEVPGFCTICDVMRRNAAVTASNPFLNF